MRRFRAVQRILRWGLLVTLTGCGTMWWPFGQVLIRGELDPFVGTLKDTFGRTVGDVVIASCGCGFWRTLIQQDDQQAETIVTFWDTGAFNGESETLKVDGFLLPGDIAAVGWFSAPDASAGPFVAPVAREHGAIERACVLCHIGDAAIWPLPPHHNWHSVSPPDCIRCHTPAMR
jgi:hypothetical protein